MNNVVNVLLDLLVLTYYAGIMLDALPIVLKIKLA